jgi:hypothetical protein
MGSYSISPDAKKVVFTTAEDEATEVSGLPISIGTRRRAS